MGKRLDKVENLVIEIKKLQETEWLLKRQVLQILKISPRTLQTLRDKGILPYSQIEGKIYYKASDIENLLNQNYIRQ